VLGDYRADRAKALAQAHPGASWRHIDLREAAAVRSGLDAELSGVVVCARQETPLVRGRVFRLRELIDTIDHPQLEVLEIEP
jgi:hypothetical protein